MRCRTDANTASSAPNTGWASISFCWSPVNTDVAADERLLRVHLTGGHGDGGVPRLLHAHVLGVGRPGAEVDGRVADLQVVHDVALGPAGDHLGDADRRAPR